MHRFFMPPESIEGETVIFPRRVVEQMRTVLRLTPGEHVVVLVNDGWEQEVEIAQVSKKDATGRIVDRRWNEREPRVEIALYQCILKKDNFEWVLQKCTEIGVSWFIPVSSERTIVKVSDESALNRLERWQRILTEAAEQSGRGRIPTLAATILPVADALQDCEPYGTKIIAWEQEGATTLRYAMENQSLTSIALFVGPEGGFTLDEVGLAWDHGVMPITLGTRILRAETAAAVLATLSIFMSGEIG